MSSSDSGQRSYRTVFLLALLLSTLGSCGAMGGLVAVRVDRVPPPAHTYAAGSEEEAVETASRRVVEVWLSAEHRKALAGANVVVSLLLLVAAAALVRRRTTAVWWTIQAVLANLALAMAEAASHAFALADGWNDLLAIAPEHPQVGLATATEAALLAAMLHLVRASLYGWIVWRVRRQDIRSVLTVAAHE